MPAMDLPSPLRPATPDDALALAQLIELASEGMAGYIWRQMAEPGETACDVGVRRARRETGAFSYKNAIVTDLGAGPVAALLGYRQPAVPAPIGPDMLAMFVPFQELENLAPDTWYVNVLAVLHDHRGQGHGTRLLATAGAIAVDEGAPGLSIIVADTNLGARRLYQRDGYREVAQRTSIKQGWDGPGNAWILLTKAL